MDENDVLVEADTKDVPVAIKDALATAHPSGKFEHRVDTLDHATDHTAATDAGSTTVPRLSNIIDRFGPEDSKQRNLILVFLLLLAVTTPVVLCRSRARSRCSSCGGSRSCSASCPSIGVLIVLCSTHRL
ncbi:hypothetical protein PR202_ga15628 [Eleusine coracana subsp. coracana]|uniref:Uncharacterized protein n=1 Tax=Eleusine coracana subsp. coracana TaxID=191504 RepID=A0AAV5CJI3_ELECO|nr:hypothetical protein PR202_ga15628 [Eleusine coracana subsp. coracana]